MNRSDGIAAHAENLLRTLAIALKSARLYPPDSPLRADLVERFLDVSHSITAVVGPMQCQVDRHRFIVADTPVGEGTGHISALAETLHSLQVRQLIIAPDLTRSEVLDFMSIIGSEPQALQVSGGIRAAIQQAGIQHLAVVEVSLRASAEEGLLGLDLTIAPLEDLARELASAAQSWLEATPSGPEPQDLVTLGIDRLEPAARDLAVARCAESLLLLDDESRIRVLAAAVAVTPGSKGMDGMSRVVAQLPPGALARLLRIAAERMRLAPCDLLGALRLPHPLASGLQRLLRTSACVDEPHDAPGTVDAAAMAREATTPDEHDIAHMSELTVATTAQDAAARGLLTTIAMAERNPDEEALKALVDALGPAIRECAFRELAAALGIVRSVAQDPALTTSAQAARTALAAPILLRSCTLALAEDGGSDDARQLLEAAGPAGAEAVLSRYLQSGPAVRDRLSPVIESMLDVLAVPAGRMLRSGDRAAALDVVRLLDSTRSSRIAPTIASGLEHADRSVRAATVAALARHSSDNCDLMRRALTHDDAWTRQIAVRAAGEARLASAIPELLAIVTQKGQDYDTKKDALTSLGMIGTGRAVPELSQFVARFTISRKGRELRAHASRVLESLRCEDALGQGGVRHG